MSADTNKLIARWETLRRTPYMYRTTSLVEAGDALASALEQAQESNTGLTERASENAVRLAAAMRQREAAEADLARAREAVDAYIGSYLASDSPLRRRDKLMALRDALAAVSGDE
jgi:hypothetical protein